jgi:hypothetical protein
MFFLDIFIIRPLSPGCCSDYDDNIDKLHDTRPDAKDPGNKEKKTTADVE